MQRPQLAARIESVDVVEADVRIVHTAQDETRNRVAAVDSQQARSQIGEAERARLVVVVPEIVLQRAQSLHQT